MKLIKPAKLKAGDTVAAITLSWGGAALYPQRYEIGKKRIKEIFGLNVVETKHAVCDAEWIYANPQARADDLMEAFSNPNIQGIFSIIGGDDSVRLLPYIDYDIIKNNPKAFLGFSDTTVTHFACLKAGLSSFYGPSILTAFAENVHMHQYTIDSVRWVLFGNQAGEFLQSKEGWTAEYLDWDIPDNQNILRKLHSPSGWRFLQGSGTANGHLIGGCVEVLQMINATEIWPDSPRWDNAVLFLETSEEGIPVNQLEWFLRNLGAQGILNRINAILFSKPGGSNVNPNKFYQYDNSILKILSEYNREDMLVVTNMDFGHTDPMMVLPYGGQIEINVEMEKMSLIY